MASTNLIPVLMAVGVLGASPAISQSHVPLLSPVQELRLAAEFGSTAENFRSVDARSERSERLSDLQIAAEGGASAENFGADGQ